MCFVENERREISGRTDHSTGAQAFLELRSGRRTFEGGDLRERDADMAFRSSPAGAHRGEAHFRGAGAGQSLQESAELPIECAEFCLGRS